MKGEVMEILEIVKKNKKEMLEDMQGLLRIDSTLVETDDPEAPFGRGIRESLDYVLALGEKMGFRVKNVNNVAGHVEYGNGEEIIGILCHVDVVPAQGNWKYPPFSGTISEGRIYSRGASDDKGPTIAALYALKALKDLGFEPQKRVRLIIGTDEESHWRGIKTYFQECEMPDFGFSPDADFPVIYGEKGIMSIDVTGPASELFFHAGDRYNVVPDEARAKPAKDLKAEFLAYLEEAGLKGECGEEMIIYGKAAHAMEPENGVNALVKMCEFLNRHLEDSFVAFVAECLTDSRFRKIKLDFSDPEMKDLTVNVAFLEIKDGKGRLGLNLRYPINWVKESFFKEFGAISEKYGLETNVVQNQPPHYVDKNDLLVKTLHRAYVHYTGDEKTPLLTIGGGTYARALKKGVAFGPTFPGREEVAHQVDEYIEIEDIVLATAIMARAVRELAR